MEIWKDIVGYEGLYQISNLGRVKSLERYKYNHKNSVQKIPEKILKQRIDKGGYKYINLCKNSKKSRFQIHRLVATAFISNPENKPCVNHLDCDRQNNNVNNLEWVTHKENTQYAVKLGKMKGSKHTPVIAINLTTGEQTCFESERETARQLELDPSVISKICKGKRKTMKGYTFRYANKQ